MKRMKFRFVAAVAIVLAFVMFVEVPVSAASFLSLSDYLFSTSSSGTSVTYKYFYPFSSSYKFIRFSGTSTSGSSYTVPDINATSSEHTTTTALKKLKIRFAPNGINKERFLFPEYSEFTSFTVSSDFVVGSSVALSGTIFLTVYYYSEDGTGFIKNLEIQDLDVEAGNYLDLAVTYDIASFLNDSTYHSFFVYYEIEFSGVPAGATISFSASPSSFKSDELDPGLFISAINKQAMQAPVFTSNLSSDTVWYLVGSAPSALSVNASVSDGGSISYQWYKSSTASGSGNVISGATGKSYTPDTSAESDCYYYCIATSTLDGEKKSAKSNVAHIGVVKKPVAPVIYSNLHTGTLEYYQDETAEPLFFGVYAPDGGTLTYQWYEGDPSYGDPKPISGATSSSYTPPTSVIGYDYYYCIATNTKGPYTQTTCSREGRIQIKAPPDPALPPVITTDLSTDPVTYKEGVAASPLRIIATSPDGGSLTYQWYEVIDGSAQILAGDTNANFTPDTSVVGEHIYYCVITNTVLNTKASVESSRATIVVQPDRTDSLLDTIIGGVKDIIDGITNLPQLIIDGIKNLFIPDAEGMAAYQDKWFLLLSSRFGAIYEAVVLIDEFGQAISEQTKQGIITFPEVTINLVGVPWTFGGWEVKVVPDGFDVVIVTLKSAVNIVCTFAFVNGLRHRFEGVIGGA